MTTDTSNPRESGKTPTPRTDAEVFFAYQYHAIRMRLIDCVDPDFARQLERELTDARAELAEKEERIKVLEDALEISGRRVSAALGKAEQ